MPSLWRTAGCEETWRVGGSMGWASGRAGRQGHETGSRPHRSIGPSTLSNVPTRTATAETDWGRSAPVKARRTAPPVLVRQVRNGVEESAHRGDIVEVDVAGRMLR